ncbi:hypothetical protein EGM51_12340 [Verrucomicrobia bacterium S94]|nr:hypothetical protein EGM51_12340 [Verrucomicrobia bacterium S94]
MTIALEVDDWGQIIDGLTCRAEDYERTAEYHESGYVEDYILEVCDASEARNMAQYYRRVVKEIRNQL